MHGKGVKMLNIFLKFLVDVEIYTFNLHENLPIKPGFFGYFEITKLPPTIMG